MAKQTINIGAAPNDGTGTPLRTSFDYCNQNFTELYTATGPSGNNIVVPGSATITGDLTVRTNKLAVTSTGVGIGTASPSETLHISKGSAATFLRIQDSSSSNYIGTDTGNFRVLNASVQDLIVATQAGVFTFGDGAGGTRMTLNSTGLLVGTGTTNPLDLTNAAVTTERQIKITNSSVTAYLGVEPAAGGRFIGSAAGNAYFGTNAAYGLEFATNNNVRMTLNTTGNLAFKNGLGIDFSDTPGTGTSELLNDYEEGTWTPTISASVGTPTTTTINLATYTKIGRIVLATFDISIVNLGTASGLLQFTLPFSQGTDNNVGCLREVGATALMGQVGSLGALTAFAALYNNATVWVNGYRIRGTYTYTV